jgi:phospholipase C
MYNGDEPLHEYQYHHQPFVFFDRFKDPESWDRREHLKDETDLLADLKNGNLPRVSMYKPYGEDNFHPGYSSVYDSEAKVPSGNPVHSYFLGTTN